MVRRGSGPIPSYTPSRTTQKGSQKGSNQVKSGHLRGLRRSDRGSWHSHGALVRAIWGLNGPIWGPFWWCLGEVWNG